MDKTPARTRIVALFAAAAVSAVLASSQFGLAHHYAGETAALLAGPAGAASQSPHGLLVQAAARRHAV